MYKFLFFNRFKWIMDTWRIFREFLLMWITGCVLWWRVTFQLPYWNHIKIRMKKFKNSNAFSILRLSNIKFIAYYCCRCTNTILSTLFKSMSIVSIEPRKKHSKMWNLWQYWFSLELDEKKNCVFSYIPWILIIHSKSKLDLFKWKKVTINLIVIIENYTHVVLKEFKSIFFYIWMSHKHSLFSSNAQLPWCESAESIKIS